jgi:hypothetical protein
MIRPLLMNGLKSGLRGLVPRKQDIQYLPPNLALHLFLSFSTLTELSPVSPEELAESVHFGFCYSIADSASRTGTSLRMVPADAPGGLHNLEGPRPIWNSELRWRNRNCREVELRVESF